MTAQFRAGAALGSVVLSGCMSPLGLGGEGGSETSFDPDPLASSGYATTTSAVRGSDETYKPFGYIVVIDDTEEAGRQLSNAAGLDLSQNTIRLTDDPNEIIFSTQNDSVTLESTDGETFHGVFLATGETLEADARLTYADSDLLARVFVSADNEYEYQNANGQTATALSAYRGEALIGYNVDPDVMATLTGTATYEGTGTLYLVTADNDIKHGIGTARVEADLGTLAVSGSVTGITDSGQGTSALEGEHSYSFSAENTGNNIVATTEGFIASVTGLSAGELGLAEIDSLLIEGRYFGPAAEAIGGAIGGSGVDADGNAVSIGGTLMAD